MKVNQVRLSVSLAVIMGLFTLSRASAQDCNNNGISDATELAYPRKVYSPTFSGGVKRYDRDGSNEEIIVPNTFSMLQAIDVAPDSLCWGFSMAIPTSLYCASLEGDDDIAMSIPFGIVQAIAIDPVDGWVYYGINNALRRIQLDGTGDELLDSGSIITGLAVDSFNRNLYWSTQGSGVIRRRNLATDFAFDFYDTGLQPQSIDVDPTSGRLYFSESTTETINWVDLTGQGAITTVLSQVPVASKVRVDSGEGNIYWLDGVNLLRADLDGANAETLFATETGFDFALLDPPNDCQPDGVPDICQVQGNDCDQNGIPDACDPDPDNNNVVDACETDCNGNGVGDGADIAAGTAPDCNNNGIIDGCESAGVIFWADRTAQLIYRSNIDVSNPSPIVNYNGNGSRGITVDEENGYIYWIDDSDDQLHRARLNGANPETVLNIEPGGYDIALDKTNQKIYLTTNETVTRADLDGANAEVVISSTGNPRGVAIDPVAGKIYWSEGTADQILRADLDGSNTEVLLDNGTLQSPRGLALDLDTQKLYWTDIQLDVVGRANLDGTGVEILSTIQAVKDISLDLVSEKWYASSATSTGIFQANLDGTGLIEFACCHNAHVTVIPPFADCNSNGAPDECDADCDADGIPNECAIDAGEVDCDSNLIPDTCELSQTPLIVWTENFPGGVYQSSIENFNPQPFPIDNSDDISSVAIDPRDNTIYFSDSSTRSIVRTQLDGSDPTVILSTGDDPSPTSLTLDLSQDKIYWRNNSGDANIQRANLDGSNVELFVENDGFEPSLAVDSVNGFVFWAREPSGDSVGEIFRSSVFGGPEEQILSGLDSPTSISVDSLNQKLYWVESGPQTDAIRRANLDGTNVEDVIASDNPINLRVDAPNQWIYFTDIDAREVRRVRPDGSDLETLGDTVGAGFRLDIITPPPDCNVNAVPDACDIDAGTEQDIDMNGVPDVCEPAAISAALADDRFDVTGADFPCNEDSDCLNESICSDGRCYVPTQRFLSLRRNPDNDGIVHRIRVSLDGDPPVVLGYAGQEVIRTVSGPGPAQYLWTEIVPFEESTAADWNALMTADGEGYMLIGDCEVSPDQHYVIELIADGDDPGNALNYSAPLALPTSQFGDATGGDAVATPPNGISNLVDVFASVLAFQSAQGGPKHWFDLDPLTGAPNLSWNLADAFAYVLAFQQVPYLGPDPLDCP
ncbi:MAG: DUF5050 domain-containing protein [Phycisphaerae bacterium]